MTNRQRDIVCAGFFLLFGVFMFIIALPIVPIMEKDLGSGFVPKIAAGAIVVVAAAKLAFALVDKTATDKKQSNDDIKGGLLTIAALGAYVLLFNMLGFIVSTVLYLFVQITLLSTEENRNFKLFALISVVSPLLIYTLFVYIIKMPLPIGVFGF